MSSSLLIILGIFRMIAIPVQFQDQEFTVTREDMCTYLERVSSYLNDQFREERSFQIDMAPAVTMQRNHDYYGNNSSDRKDERLRDLVYEACTASKSDVDFSLYDNDGDGTADAVLLISSGLSEADGAGEDMIWPQESMIENYGAVFSIGGTKINTFVICPELKSEAGENPRPMTIGTMVHELGHIFGLMDMYDTDGELSGGLSKGLWGTLSLMDHGLENDGGNTPPFFNAVELEQLGLGDCDTLRTGSYQLPPLGNHARYLIMPGTARGTSYILECRKEESWDRFIGGHGLVVYHVDRSGNPAGYSDYFNMEISAYERWKENQVNCNPDFQCAVIEAADTSATDVSGVFYPREGITSLALPPYALTDIAFDGDNVSFNVIEPLTITGTVCFQDAAIINWTVDDAISESACSVRVRKEREHSDYMRIDVGINKDGSYSLTIEGLEPRTDYRATIHVALKDGKSFTRRVSFKTKSYSPGVLPFIYLNSAERGPGGTFISGSRIPLRVYNAPEAAEVLWYFDGRRIEVGEDGYFHIMKSGLLKAEVHYEDGSMDAIEKQVTVQS